MDEAANQLPYVDRVVISIVEDTEVYMARILSGESDVGFMNDVGVKLIRHDIDSGMSWSSFESDIDTADLSLGLTWAAGDLGATIADVHHCSLAIRPGSAAAMQTRSAPGAILT